MHCQRQPSANLCRIQACLTSHFPSHTFPSPPPPPHRSLEDTPLLFVNTPASLQQMVEELRAARHIAIDLENHNFRKEGDGGERGETV